MKPATHRPFRFGVQARTSPSRSHWVDLARRVEDRGYSTLTLPDHFDDQLAPGIALMAAADATEELRIGTMVLCNDYRHPVVLAKEAATLDLLSDGRLELGIGAGWMRSDYDQAGMDYDRPGVRIERMVESVTVLKGLFGDDPFSFSGEHYTISELNGTPKPVQRPHPPFLIGGGGPRFLRLAAEMADIVGINPNLAAGTFDSSTGADGTAKRYEEKIGWVREAAGDRFDDIELQVRVFFVLHTNDRMGTAEAVAPTIGLTAEEGLESPLALAGTVEQMIADLVERRERYGFSYIVIGQDDYEAFAPVVTTLAGT